ncbi:uncharacterized protein LOC112568655 [Pomacea canaliculata]|uniref:uncharacterized protein LOC112568655 n=1 Tax=Pomacea canaliculata TaxID=400727 RepID=UPI000D73B1F6|nr:uncharacterized protein LOC112568655 [Pomacea canaliculata]
MRSFSAWILILVMLVGLTNGQTKYCCSINQWEGLQSRITGTAPHGVGSLIKEDSYVYYDSTNRRVAAFLNTTSPTENTENFFLEVYTGSVGRIYILDLLTRKCTLQVSSLPFSGACVPDNATKLSDIFFGTSVNPLNAVAYHLLQEVAGSKLEVVLTVTADGSCVPVTQLVTGAIEGEPVMQVTGYTNIRPGISRPSVFNVPPECQGVSEVETKTQRFRRSATGAGLPSVMNNLFRP